VPERLAPFVLLVLFVALCACGDSGSPLTDPQPPAPGPFSSPPDDAFYALQWHLENNGGGGLAAGEDMRAEAAWALMTGAPAEPVTGRGVRICVIDDGLQQTHEDLGANTIFGAGGAYDGMGNLVSADPTPADPDNDHGTAVAGVAAGIGHNAIGICGVAPRASLVGIVNAGTDASNAAAMTKDLEANQVFNMSYGPDENGYYTLTPLLERNAIATGLAGRGGLGVVYLRAAGNGGAPTGAGADPMQPDRWGHHSNLDGFNNEYGVIVIAATDGAGNSPVYNQRGTCVTVAAPSSGAPGGVVTTSIMGAATADLATWYQTGFGGTSSACPTVAGVVALMLQVNAGLTWRDVRRILATTARQNDAGDGGWAMNGAGEMVHHGYGYGVVDAGAAVIAAATFTSLGAAVVAPAPSPVTLVNMAVPDDMPAGISTMTTVAGAPMGTDQIILRLTMNTTNLRDHRVVLTSPMGTVSTLLIPQPLKDGPVPAGESGNLALDGEIRLCTVFTQGEDPNGTWSLTVSDEVAGRATTAAVVSWFLDVYAD
jgi:subtilisin-like proprotein convertase family protein